MTHLLGVMELILLENGEMIKDMDKETLFQKMVFNNLESGYKI